MGLPKEGAGRPLRLDLSKEGPRPGLGGPTGRVSVCGRSPPVRSPPSPSSLFARRPTPSVRALEPVTQQMGEGRGSA